MARSKTKKAVSAKSRSTSVDLSSIVEDEFGNYRIRAGRLSGNFVARAFPKTGAMSQGLMAEATGASEIEAIAELKSLLGERDAKRTAARRWELRSNISVPSKEEYVEALRQTKLSEPQLSMLKAQAIAGEKGLTTIALMNAAGYKSRDMAIKVMVRAGALVGDFLGVEVQSDDSPERYQAACVLGFREETRQDAPEIWIMHEELRHAVWATL